MLDFPTSRRALGPRLSLDAWQRVFDARWAALGARYFLYERLQAYAEPARASYRAFREGAPAAHAVTEDAASEEASFVSVCQRGVHYVRAHAIERPLTTYLRWEIQIYAVLARYGQRILILDLDAALIPPHLPPTYDFLLFDDDTVMVQDYGDDGVLCGGWHTTDPATVALFIALAREIQAHSVPLAAFERAEARRSADPQ